MNIFKGNVQNRVFWYKYYKYGYTLIKRSMNYVLGYYGYRWRVQRIQRGEECTCTTNNEYIMS